MLSWDLAYLATATFGFWFVVTWCYGMVTGQAIPVVEWLLRPVKVPTISLWLLTALLIARTLVG
jgi:hypothetical protein